MNRIDRRALFTSGAAAALLAATGTSVHGAPKRGGTLRLAIPRDEGLMQRLALWASHDALVEIGPDGVLRGELATSWRSTETAKRWAMELRTDAKFHSGADVTVDDVVSSLQRGLGETVHIFAEANNKIVVDLAEPNSHFPYVLAAENCLITQGGDDIRVMDPSTGSGCYHMTRVQDDRHFRAERLANHYKADKAGWLDAIEVAVIPDANIRAEALRDGFVDVAGFPAAQLLKERRDLSFHPSVHDMQLVAHHGVGVPRQIGTRSGFDDMRLIERWWMV